MTTTWSAEKQGASQGEREGDMKLKLIIPPEKEMEDVEECKTPTWLGNKIPSTLKCPPAPRKKRLPAAAPNSSSHMMRRSSASEMSFFEEVMPEEIEMFFQSMNESARVNKRRKSI